VILLDRSGSMSHKDVWPAAQDSARKLIDGIGVSDRVAVVLFDEEAEIAQSFTQDHGVAKAAVNVAKPGQRGTRFAAALRAARQLLIAAPDATHEIYVVTDLQRSGVTDSRVSICRQASPFAQVPVGSDMRANTAVSSVDVRRVSGTDRASVAAQARITTHELSAPLKVHVTLALNGRPSGSRDATLPASGDFTVAFDPVPLPSGRVTGTVTIDPDDLPFDDTFRFTLPDEDELRVLLLAPDDVRPEELLYFERAVSLGKGPTVRVERHAAECRRRESAEGCITRRAVGHATCWNGARDLGARRRRSRADRRAAARRSRRSASRALPRVDARHRRPSYGSRRHVRYS